MSQTRPVNFGTVTEKEMLMDSYDKDPDAEALILFNTGEVKYVETGNGDYNIRLTRKIRYKIFQKSALDLAEVSIPFFIGEEGRIQDIKDVEANSYNYEDGKIVKRSLDLTEVYEEKQENNEWAMKFAVPGVKEGSVFEFKYINEYSANYWTIPSWYFQAYYPVKYSEFVVRMIPFYEYVYIKQGDRAFDYQRSELSTEQRFWGDHNTSYRADIQEGVKFNDYVHTYVMEDIPAFRGESFITSVDDYINKISFQLSKINYPTGGSTTYVTTWPSMIESKEESDYFGKYVKKSEKAAKKIIRKELDLDGLTEHQKAKEIITFVKNNYDWNYYWNENSSQDVKSFLENEKGNVADINLFLVGMLRAADIEAYPVISSTRDHGRINLTYPFYDYFNYTMVLVNTETPFLTDASRKSLKYNRIPPDAINDKGLLIKKGSVDWIILQNDILSVQNNLLRLTPNLDSNDLEVYLSSQSTEYTGFSYRDKYDDDTTALKEKYLDHLDEISRIRTFNYDNTNLPYIIGLEGKKKLEVFAGNIAIKPFLGLSFEENPFKSEERNYPADFTFAQSDQFDVTITIPKGYKVYEVPENYSIDDDLVSISADYQLSQEALKIKASYVFKKPVYQPEEYATLRAHMDKIVEIVNQDVVLEEAEAMVSK
jgi:transglutaminase-like putative cysteine protease